MAQQFVGRDVVVNYAIALETASPGGLTFKRLGMMRGKSMKTSWDTVDTTADRSPAFTKTNLVTFKSVEFSGDGVTFTDASENQNEFKAHVISPGSATGNQPKVWLQLIDPAGDKYEGPFIVTEWSDDRPYSDAATWSMTAMSNGAVNFTAA
jgi:predicted secreted protein